MPPPAPPKLRLLKPASEPVGTDAPARTPTAMPDAQAMVDHWNWTYAVGVKAASLLYSEDLETRTPGPGPVRASGGGLYERLPRLFRSDRTDAGPESRTSEQMNPAEILISMEKPNSTKGTGKMMNHENCVRGNLKTISRRRIRNSIAVIMADTVPNREDGKPKRPMTERSPSRAISPNARTVAERLCP